MLAAGPLIHSTPADTPTLQVSEACVILKRYFVAFARGVITGRRRLMQDGFWQARLIWPARYGRTEPDPHARLRVTSLAVLRPVPAYHTASPGPGHIPAGSALRPIKCLCDIPTKLSQKLCKERVSQALCPISAPTGPSLPTSRFDRMGWMLPTWPSSCYIPMRPTSRSRPAASMRPT
jgi:hypothetical protein